jgi:hypothetical protein
MAGNAAFDDFLAVWPPSDVKDWGVTIADTKVIESSENAVRFEILVEGSQFDFGRKTSVFRKYDVLTAKDENGRCFAQRLVLLE